MVAGLRDNGGWRQSASRNTRTGIRSTKRLQSSLSKAGGGGGGRKPVYFFEDIVVPGNGANYMSIRPL